MDGIFINLPAWYVSMTIFPTLLWLHTLTASSCDSDFVKKKKKEEKMEEKEKKRKSFFLKKKEEEKSFFLKREKNDFIFP